MRTRDFTTIILFNATLSRQFHRHRWSNVNAILGSPRWVSASMWENDERTVIPTIRIFHCICWATFFIEFILSLSIWLSIPRYLSLCLSLFLSLIPFQNNMCLSSWRSCYPVSLLLNGAALSAGQMTTICCWHSLTEADTMTSYTLQCTNAAFGFPHHSSSTIVF